MRILVLHSLLGVLRGGGENFTRNLFTAFAERGHSIAAVFAADMRGAYPLELPSSLEPLPIAGWWPVNLGQRMLATVGCRISHGTSLKAGWDHLQGAIGWRTFRWHNRRFMRLLGRKLPQLLPYYDAVYVHGDVHLAGQVARHCPTVLRLPGPVTAELEPVLRSIHAVCANGDALQSVRAWLGDHAVELPIGLDGRLFAPGPTSVRSHLGWSEEHKVIGYVGRLSHIKGVGLLADAFRELTPMVPQARLLIIGSGQEERSIRSVLANELARGVAHIEGDVDHGRLPEWYRAMDLLVMPSRYENFSNALIEGMGCGIPFLASDIGGSRTLAQVGAGWLFEPSDKRSLIASLRQAMRNSGETRARGERGASYVAGRYSWSDSARRLEGIIGTIRVT